jgi:hypothetical protein
MSKKQKIEICRARDKIHELEVRIFEVESLRPKGFEGRQLVRQALDHLKWKLAFHTGKILLDKNPEIPCCPRHTINDFHFLEKLTQ